MPESKDKSGKNPKQVARNDADKCDMTKYRNKSDLPKDCKEKGGTGAAHVSSTQKQSGGDSGSSSAAGAGAGASSSTSGSSSK